MRGYPTSAASGSAARAGASSFQGALGSYIAWQSGARAAALLARVIPYIGTAAIVAYGLMHIRNRLAGVAAHTGFNQICDNGDATDWTEWGGDQFCTPSAYFNPLSSMNNVASNATAYWGYRDPNAFWLTQGFYAGYNVAMYQRQVGYTGPVYLTAQPDDPARWINLPPPPAVPAPMTERMRQAVLLAGAALPETEKKTLNSVPMYWAYPASYAPPARPLSWASANIAPAFLPRTGVGVGAVVVPTTRPVARPLPVVIPTPVVRSQPVAPGAVVRPAAPARVVPYPVAVPRYPAIPNGVPDLKTRVLPVFNQLIRPFNNATEAGDFVKAMHDALPPCRKTKSPKALRQAAAARRAGKWDKKYRKADISAAEKLRDVVSFLTDLRANPGMRRDQMCGGTREADRLQSFGARGGYKQPVGQHNSALEEYTLRALGHLANEQAKDLAWGKLGRDLGKINRELGLPFGVQTLRSVSQFKLDIPK